MSKKITSFIGVTHYRADYDELSVFSAYERFARQVFPGLAMNPLMTVDAGFGSGKDGDYWEKRGYVPVGVLGGRGDEHGKGDGKSAFTLAMERIGMTENKGMKPILAYALKADDRATDAPFNVATIIKNLHAYGVPLEVVRQMNNRWFNAHYNWFNEYRFPVQVPVTLKDIAIQLLLKSLKLEAEGIEPSHSFGDVVTAAKEHIAPEYLAEMREIEMFIDYVAPTTLSPFNLAGMVTCMQETGVPMETIINDVLLILQAKMFVQRQFLDAELEFGQHAAFLDDCPLKVAVIRSDNEQMNRAARESCENLPLLIQVRSSGHVQIFSDHRRDLRPILGRLRVAEERKAGRNYHLSNEQLASGGTLPQIRQWFGFEKYGKIIAIFNGSLKTKSVPRTRLTCDEVLTCVRDGLAHTHRARGVERANSSLSA